MTDEEKREALLKLAQLAGIPNPETIHSNSLSFVISCTLDEMLNQFYKYRYEEAPDEDEPQDKKKKISGKMPTSTVRSKKQKMAPKSQTRKRSRHMRMMH